MYRPTRTAIRLNLIARLLLFVWALGLGLFATRPAEAQLNGSFTNNGSGWSGTGPATNGAPSVVTNNNGKTVLRIGVNNGVPGVPGGKVTSTGRNGCEPSLFTDYCAVYFHADWTPVGNETATVTVSYKSSTGQAVVSRNIPASGDHVVNAYDQCPSLVTITFNINSGGKPVNSTLDISDVSISCDFFDNSTLAALPPPPYGEPRTAAYPLPYGSRQNGTLAVMIPQGLSPLANPFSSGSNRLDEVLIAEDDTILYKYNPLTGAFESYYRSLGEWFPADGTLGPGDAAFIDSPMPQELTLSGQYVPLPLGRHPSSGSAYFANPVPWPVLLEDLMGFKPVVGDVLLTFKHGDTNSAPPATTDSGFIFQPDTFALQPAIGPGETVQVFFGDPRLVPLSSRLSGGNFLVSAPGDLPSDGLLQAAGSLGPNADWKSLLGVADYYSEPATSPARFFRLGFNVPSGSLYGYLTQANHAPANSLTVQLAPNGASQITDNFGRFSFFDVPVGLVDLQITAPVQVVDMSTSQISVFPVSLPLTVNITAQTTVNLKENIVAQVLKQPTCDCVPWCGVVGGTVNGVQKVVAGGGKLPPNCNGVATVTITGPGGINANLGQGGERTFSPAANGTWTVTSTVCGISKTCSITLP